MSVRPLVLWVSRQQATSMRFTRRDPEVAAGMLTKPSGTVPFTYDRVARQLRLPGQILYLDDYGWEVDEQGRTVFHSRRPD